MNKWAVYLQWRSHGQFLQEGVGGQRAKVIRVLWVLCVSDTKHFTIGGSGLLFKENVCYLCK